MNAISKALADMKFRIPRQILDETFSQYTHHWRNTPVSVDEQILNKVIKSRVLVDCNLVGGTETILDLSKCSKETIDTYNTVYYVPKELTQGRVIVTALSVNSNAITADAYSQYYTGNYAARMASALGAASSPAPYASTARLQLIAENTVLVSEAQVYGSFISMRVILADDENMSHLQIRSIPAFTKLVEYALKSYIYNELIIRMDMGMIKAGQDLGRFKEVVDGYADAEEMYQDYLINKWAATAYMNDQETMRRFIKMQLGSVK